MAIQGLASSVVAHSGARVSVAGRFLDVTKRNSSVERGGDERVPQRMRPDPLGDPRPPGHATHDPSGSVTVESLAVAVDEDGSLEALTDREIDRPGNSGASGIVTTLPPLRITVRVR